MIRGNASPPFSFLTRWGPRFLLRPPLRQCLFFSWQALALPGVSAAFPFWAFQPSLPPSLWPLQPFALPFSFLFGGAAFPSLGAYRGAASFPPAPLLTLGSVVLQISTPHSRTALPRPPRRRASLGLFSSKWYNRAPY